MLAALHGNKVIDITLFGGRAVLTIRGMTGRQVLKTIPALKRLGKIKDLSDLISKCRKSLDKELFLDYCG